MKQPVTRSVRKVDLTALGKLRKLPAYLKDPEVSTFKKVAMVLGAAYIVFPFDFLPDVVPILGWLDDIGVLGALSLFLMRELEQYVLSRHDRTHLPGSHPVSK